MSPRTWLTALALAMCTAGGQASGGTGSPSEHWARFHVSQREDVAVQGPDVGASSCDEHVSHPAAGDAAQQQPLVFGMRSASACRTLVAIRFAQVQLPRGAKVAAASLTVESALASAVSAAAGGYAVSLDIYADDCDNSSPLTESTGSLSCRRPTQASVAWSPGAWSNVQEQTSPNLAPIIQSIVSRPGWRRGNALTLLVRSSSSILGSRAAVAFREGKPFLNVAWEGVQTIGSSGCDRVVAASHAQQCNDRGASGKVNTSSESLDLGYGSGCPSSNPTNLVALRFDSILIPRGARVTYGKLELMSRKPRFELAGPQAGSPPTFRGNHSHLRLPGKSTWCRKACLVFLTTASQLVSYA